MLVLPNTIAPAEINRRHHGRVGRRLEGEARAGGGCRQSGHVDVVLDGDEEAGQRKHFSCRYPCIDDGRFGRDGRRIAQIDPDLRSVGGTDPLEGQPDALHRRQIFRNRLDNESR